MGATGKIVVSAKSKAARLTNEQMLQMLKSVEGKTFRELLPQLERGEKRVKPPELDNLIRSIKRLASIIIHTYIYADGSIHPCNSDVLHLFGLS